MTSGVTITGISSMATRRVLADLSAAYEKRFRQRVAVEFAGGVDVVRRIETGEVFDFVVLAAAAIDKLAAAGLVDAATCTNLARSRVAIAVPAGAHHPDLRTEAAVRAAVLAAARVGYSTGPSGEHFAALLRRWGIDDVMAPRLVKAPPGVPVGALLARGEVDMGLQQLSELIGAPGIDVAGTLPAEIAAVTVFAGAVCTASAQHAAARALLSFYAADEFDDTKRRYGMEP